MRACSPPLTFHRTGPLQTEIQEIDQYLKKMGVSDPSLRRRVETQLPYTSGDAVSSALAAAHRMEPLVHLNAAGRALLEGAGASNAAAPAVALVLCCDADGGGGGMESLLAQLELPALALRLPDESEEGGLDSAPPDVPQLARLGAKLLRAAALPPACRLALAGVGFGALLAHDLALQHVAVVQPPARVPGDAAADRHGRGNERPRPLGRAL